MTKLKSSLEQLRGLLQPILVEVEMAMDTQTYPDWTVVKDHILQSLELVRKLERDQIWQPLRKGK